MGQINYEKLLPQKPVADVVAFALGNGEFQGSYLIYQSERVYKAEEEGTEDCVSVVCTACGQKFHAEKVRVNCCNPGYAPAPFGWKNIRFEGPVFSGDETLCPCCGVRAKSVHIGNMRAYGGELVSDAWVSELLRVPVDGQIDRLALVEWCVRRCINKQGVTRYEIWPFSAWVVEEKVVVRLMGYLKNIGGNISLFGEWRQRKKFVDVYGVAQLIVPWDKSMLEGTTAENSKLSLYAEHGKHFVSYLALWRRHAAVENLLMQGCGGLVETWICREAQSGLYHGGIPKLDQVNWKQKRPAKMLGLTKCEFRQMLQQHWGADTLETYKLVRDSELPVHLPEDMELLKDFPPYECSLILEEAPKADFWRTLRYLKKQNEHWHTLRDYRNMAAREGRDLTDSLVRFPRNLKAAHDRYVEERRIRLERQSEERRKQELAERRPLFEKRAAELEWLRFETDGLLIRPCANEEELIREGHELHHCVSTYAKSHAEGKTAILFIRQKSKPDKPFFTLELDEKTLLVQQNRGLRNCDRTSEIESFEKAWMNWIRQAKRKGKAA